MTCKLFYLLLAIAPLWIPGLHKAATAQASAEISLPITPAIEPTASTPTSIQPATSATTVIQQANQFTITGGQSSGNPAPNLIHQFQQFDLKSTDEANFVVNPDVANVISLINSAQPSSIDGLLKLTSNDPDLASSANLFLVNPAGIIFGENISLNLPADLTATTASALLFDNTYLLSIDGNVSEIALPTNEVSGVSSINVSSPTLNNLTGEPTGYLLLSTPNSSAISDPLAATLPTGSIENQGNLQVAPHAAINLVGQYVQNDGNLIAPSGIVNLVAKSGDNLLHLSQPGSLISLDVIPADTLEVLSPVAGNSSTAALPSTAIAQLLTGGEEESATKIVNNPDGSQTLASAPSLTPRPGTVLVRGEVDVSNNMPTNQTSSPGTVNILGDQINLIGGDINANGVDQGGTIFIGGMPVIDNFRAAYVVVGRGSEITANASKGTGGTIHIWADDTLKFYGSATATGVDSARDGSVIINTDNVLDIRQQEDTGFR
ncbi:filamentous hemagglutinin N-terminal domain-containing protein [Leptothoe spongobia TAU-MAC 1115]|uniref:Filamentous hemagglutinin N-terminal domain-containing protein n=2 Tax=Leptothoe TaxID=2651725 RepID=A0A947DDG2_9CYAN|nr:filamentous hemagglutinin N-terminal domain-containing protein [Leptothoe spongobia TAU-MAC 1115]